jgi:hypothetical protein
MRTSLTLYMCVLIMTTTRTVLQAMSKLEAILIDIDRDSKESLISGSSIESAQHNARRARRQAFADAGSNTI